MNDINEYALGQAEVAAAKLWALGSAPFPYANGATLQRHVEREVTDTAISFAISTRRILDNNSLRDRFTLEEPLRVWSPTPGLTKVRLLRDALNRIVHATEFQVGFELLPADKSNFKGGAIGVIYLRVRTDQREDALVDVFALASCFYHRVLPAIRSAMQ